jgi:hypothetical protein
MGGVWLREAAPILSLLVEIVTGIRLRNAGRPYGAGPLPLDWIALVGAGVALLGET